MKVYLGGFICCGVHNEKQTIQTFIEYGSCKDVELTDNFEDADLIIYIDSCVATEHRLIDNINFLELVLERKKKDAKVILSGCLANGSKYEYDHCVNNILEQVTIVPSNDVVKYVLEMFGCKLDDEDMIFTDLPFSYENTYLRISPVKGCSNHCSFCKNAYMNFDLKSVPMERIKDIIAWLERNKSRVNIYICSSNFSMYGVDLYGSQMAHNVIRLFSESDSVLSIYCGSLINFYPELVAEILNNTKLRAIDVSLETGSPRLYKTMKRPISLEKWTETISIIRKFRPDLPINTEIIAGYPGETWSDVKQTLDVVYELGLWVPTSGVHEYVDSPGLVASSKLPHQLSKPEIVEHAEYYRRVLKPHNESVLRKMGLM